MPSIGHSTTIETHQRERVPQRNIAAKRAEPSAVDPKRKSLRLISKQMERRSGDPASAPALSRSTFVPPLPPLKENPYNISMVGSFWPSSKAVCIRSVVKCMARFPNKIIGQHFLLFDFTPDTASPRLTIYYTLLPLVSSPSIEDPA